MRRGHKWENRVRAGEHNRQHGIESARWLECDTTPSSSVRRPSQKSTAVSRPFHTRKRVKRTHVSPPHPLPTVFARLSPAGNFLIFTDNPPAAAAKPNQPLSHRARTMCVKYLKDMRREREPGVIDMDLKTRPHGDRGCARLGWIGFETMGGGGGAECASTEKGFQASPHPAPPSTRKRALFWHRHQPHRRHRMRGIN